MIVAIFMFRLRLVFICVLFICVVCWSGNERPGSPTAEPGLMKNPKLQGAVPKRRRRPSFGTRSSPVASTISECTHDVPQAATNSTNYVTNYADEYTRDRVHAKSEQN